MSEIERLQWSDEERSVLREMMASAGFLPVKKLIEHLKRQSSWAYNNAPSDHRYYQGKLHGVFEVATALENMSAPVKKFEEIEDQTLARMLKSPVSSGTDY